MAAIHDLIKQIEDTRLRERLLREWAVVTKEKKFGLVFEHHLPELLPVYSARPRRGDTVALKSRPLNEIWRQKTA
ncbi:MAG: hypothetical protein ACJ8LN_12035 [Sulfurifustis sp.]